MTRSYSLLIPTIFGSDRRFLHRCCPSRWQWPVFILWSCPRDCLLETQNNCFLPNMLWTASKNVLLLSVVDSSLASIPPVWPHRINSTSISTFILISRITFAKRPPTVCFDGKGLRSKFVPSFILGCNCWHEFWCGGITALICHLTLFWLHFWTLPGSFEYHLVKLLLLRDWIFVSFPSFSSTGGLIPSQWTRRATYFDFF